MWRMCKKRRFVQWNRIAILLAIFFGGFLLIIGPVQTLASLQRIDNYPLYVMEYHGGYSLLSRAGIVDQFQQESKIPTVRPGTSTSFAALNPDGYALFGRNLDWWNSHPATLLLFTDPPNGYASVAMVSIDLLGYENGVIPWHKRLQLLLSPYLIQDGMNEYGVAIAAISSPCRIGKVDQQKRSIDSSQAMRLVLDHARNVDEAVELLQEGHVRFSGMCAHHHIADAFGNSAIVEYIDGAAVITRQQEPWQIATNFLISEVKPQGSNGPCWRYMQAYEKLSQHQGHISSRTAMQLLEDVSTSTIWSIVYNLSTGSVELSMGRNYGLLYAFSLDMEIQFQPRIDTLHAALRLPQ